MGKRLAQIKVENVEENRRQYRHLLFTSGEAMSMIDNHFVWNTVGLVVNISFNI